MSPADYYLGLESTLMRHRLEKVPNPAPKNEFP